MVRCHWQSGTITQKLKVEHRWHHTPDSVINVTGTLLEGMEVVLFMSELFIVDQKVNVEKKLRQAIIFSNICLEFLSF